MTVQLALGATPVYGVGMGLRPAFFSDVLKSPRQIPWFEIQSEDFLAVGGRALSVLDWVREHYPLVLHGVGLSIGSSDPINRDYCKQLKRLIAYTQPAWVSDHLCWSSIDGTYIHDLLPIPYTEKTLTWVVDRIKMVQDILERPIVLENISSYLAYQASTIKEWDFMRMMAQEADCYLLLDVNNVYVSGFNLNFDPMVYLNALPVERVVQMHLAGYTDKGNYLLDSHGEMIHPPVLALYQQALQLFGAVPTSIEWDNNIPNFPTMLRIQQQLTELTYHATA